MSEDMDPLTTNHRRWGCAVHVYVFLTLGLLSPWVGPGVQGQVLQCRGSDGCRCTLDDGRVIDVSSLGNSDGTPRFDKVLGADGYHYSVNPCHPFSQGTCSDAAVCQVSADQSAFYQAGDANTAAWSYDGVSAVVYYESDSSDAFRQSWVTYICDPSADDPTIDAKGEQIFSTYYFDVKSKCACPGGCSASSASGGEEGGLSGGSIVLIAFFVLVFVYFAAGMVFNRTRRQATGIEMVPNVDFWRALPGLVKDGFVFVVSKIRGGGSRSGYAEV